MAFEWPAPEAALQELTAAIIRDITESLVRERDDAMRAAVLYGQGFVHATEAMYPPEELHARIKAHDRSIELLKEWLSPKQRADYEQHGYFEVVGCNTGAIYLITDGRLSFNIHCHGRSLCFGPNRLDWAGDIMLAQKIALETNETYTITEVANSRPTIIPGRVY